MDQAVQQLFDRYERCFNQALKNRLDLDAISDLYADVFVASSPLGIATGKNDDELKNVLIQAFEHYRNLGTKHMEVRNVRVTPIDELHAIAHVDWRGSYEAGGGTKVIDFANVYLVRLEGHNGKVFGWITGDENAELRKHGIA